MKHVHVLPTDKPSTLFKDDFGKLIYSINMDQEQNHFEPQHLFITSDEENKQGDWCIYKTGEIIHYLVKLNIDNLKKIILTTDPDLIKDGVQAIDDDFLEWFVKNPSCEEVKTYIVKLCTNCGQQHCDNIDCRGYKDETQYLISFPNNTTQRIITYCDGYEVNTEKIIIPKEEPKQETLEEEFKFKNRQMGAAGFVGNKIMENMISKFKQETPEEVAHKMLVDYGIKSIGQSIGVPTVKKLMVNMAKWQAERMYSEEEVFNLCREFAIFAQRNGPSYKKQQEWFEQFKRKA